MATQTFACPACGSHKALNDPRPGEKLHCTCGMSFPASPVFAVAAKRRGNRLSGTGWAVGVAAALLIGTAGAAAWLMSRPRAQSPEHPVGPVVTQATQNPDSIPAAPDRSPPAAEATGNPTPPAPPPTVSANPPSRPSNRPQAPPPAATPAASLSAVTLWDAFDLDPTAAAARYTDKLLEVTAHGKLAKDGFGKTYFGAEVVKPRGKTTARLSPQVQQWEKDGYPPSVRFYLAPEQAALLEKVSADRDVVFRGTCTGRKDRQDVYQGYIVEMVNCTVVNPR